MTSPIDIRPDHLEMVQDVLRAHLPDGAQAWVFGSRATWTTKDSSDLDLAVQANGKIAARVMGELEDAFRESDLPYTVDVVDLAAVDGRFKEVVESQKVSLPLGLDGADGRSEWRKVKFGDCATLVRDTVSPSDYMETPYIGLEHIGVDTLSLLDVGIAGDVSSAKSRFQSGDVLFGKLRPYFRKVIRARFDGICSTDIWVVRPTDGVDAGYLFYVMASQDFVDVATQGSEGTKMPRAKWEYVSRHEIPLPPLAEQREIAHILGTFDDKIDLNRRMNETLEEMARALFTSWFVDYDPVRAKIDGRWRRGESLPGLPADLYDLFPARMVESELGEVPEGWEVRGLGECLSALVSGQRPRGGAVESGVPSIGAENIIGLGRYNFTSEKYVPVDFFAKLKARGADVRNGDVLLYKDGAHIGRKTYFDRGFPHSECAINEHVFILRMQEPAAQRHLFFWLDQPWMTREIVTLNSNSAQPGINQTGVRGLPLLLPPTSLLEAFNRMTGAMTDRIFANCHESRTLGAMRDALLPGLVSGEVGVAETSDADNRGDEL